MKKLLFAAIISFLVSSLNAQAPLNLESQEIGHRIYDATLIPKVKGKVLNYSPEKDAELFITYVVVLLGGEMQETRTTHLDARGNFTLNLSNALPYQQIWFSLGDYYYGEILANEDLTITADLEILKKNSVKFYGKGISFSGIDGEINTLVNQRVKSRSLIEKKLMREAQQLKRERNGNLAEKIQKLRQVYEKLAKADDNFLKDNPTDKGWIFANERQSDFYGDLFLLHYGKKINSQLLEEGLQHKPALISNSSHTYYRYLNMMLASMSPEENAKMNQEIFAKKIDDTEQGKEIAQFLTEYKKKSNKEPYDEAQYKAGRKFFKQFEKDFQAARTERFLEQVSKLPQKSADILKVVGQPTDLYARESYLEKVLPLTKTPWIKEFLEKNMEQDQTQMAQIETSLRNSANLQDVKGLGKNILNPNAHTKLYVSTQKDVESLMSSLINTYDEKSLILDIWATWCGPCISDMKQSTPVKKELKKLPIEVIYLCVANGSDQDKWKKKVLELELSGTHVFLDKKLSAEVMEKYKLSGYPSYLFIDKDRNIDKNFIQGISRIDVNELKKRL